MSRQIPALLGGKVKFTALSTVVGVVLSLLSACSTPETVVGANWSGPREIVSGREFTPERAIRREISGWALLWCVTGDNQSMKDCVVAGEYPQGEGFGDAALRMQGNLKAQEVSAPGAQVPTRGEVVLFPLAFCQPVREAECAQMKTSRETYRLQLLAISKLIRDGRCDDAKMAAAKTGQPIILPLVAEACLRSTAATN